MDRPCNHMFVEGLSIHELTPGWRCMWCGEQGYPIMEGDERRFVSRLASLRSALRGHSRFRPTR